MKLDTICVSCMEDDSGSPTCPRCGAPANLAVSNRLLLPPRAVLREQYLIGRTLGHGGFGITYLAWDIGLHTRLAVKEYMPMGVADRASDSKVVPLSEKNLPDYEWGLDRFMEEARLLKKRNHGNIVSVDTVFRDNGTAYLVMEYLEGMTFEEFLRVRGGAIPFDDALRIMLPAMDALDAAHEDGVLHRDVSPDNILITRTGKVKLIDFGAARHALSRKSRHLTVILKSGYTPEEQYRQSGEQGAWTDVYAAAATFYRAITGKVPPASLDRQAAETIELPSHSGVAIPAGAEAALTKALAVRARDRFQSMEEFKKAILGSGARSKPAPVVLPAVKAPAIETGSAAGITATAATRALSPLEEKIRKYESSAPVSAAPTIEAPAPIASKPSQPLRGSRALPKWLVPLVAGILFSAVLGGLGLRYWQKHTQQETVTTAWPTQPTNIPQSDVERQRALEAQVQQQKNDAVPEVHPSAADTTSAPTQTTSGAGPMANSSPKAATTQPAAAPKRLQPAAVKTPTEEATAVAPLTPPPPSPVSYDDKLNQAEKFSGGGAYTQAQTVLASAVQSDPSDWRAYDELGKLALYHLNDSAHAFQYYRAALAKGGQATMRVSLDHGTGWLNIQKGKAALQDATGLHSFDRSDVLEAKRNKTSFIRIGKGRQAFHIKLAGGDTYNFEPSSNDPAEEVDFILAVINKVTGDN